VSLQSDGTLRIHWLADGYEAIHVQARFWPPGHAQRLAQAVADVALTNRTLHDLRRGLRQHFAGMFDIEAPDQDAPDRRVLISFHPPPGEPNPDE
jgi:hypothetical protein